MQKNKVGFRILSVISGLLLSFNALSTPQHGIAMHGDLKYPKDFSHFDYVNPEAPKGGTLKLAVVGDNFDSFNPFVIKGVTAAGVMGYLYESLTKGSDDEAFTEYGLLAETIETPADRSYVRFTLRPEAKFNDGSQITADDVKFSFETLTKHEKAQPFYAAYYGDVANVVVESPSTIKFEFSTNQNKELPLIIGQMPVLSKQYWTSNDFGKTSLSAPVSSGPYLVEKVEAGKSVTYVKNADYWGKKVNVNIGKYSFDKIIFEYYKDNTVALEAFKAGEYDFRVESTARNWANAYVGKKFDDGTLIKEEVTHERPSGLQAFVFNTRRDVFSQVLVREAIAQAFDFEWTNANLFNGQYTRSDSYFENSELASSGLPSEAELSVLTPLKSQLSESIFSKPFQVPTTLKPSSIRKNLRRSFALLEQAGWELKDGKMTNLKSGRPLNFEFLIVSKDFERVVLPFAKNLEKLGVDVSVRLVDVAQYINRLREFDFDMTVSVFGQSNSPGNEQKNYWHSSMADQPGSRNYAGIKDPVVDQLVSQIISAPDRVSLVNRTKALDRVLLSGHYVIPNWFNPHDRIAYSSRLARPDITPKTGVDINTWWIK